MRARNAFSRATLKFLDSIALDNGVCSSVLDNISVVCREHDLPTAVIKTRFVGGNHESVVLDFGDQTVTSRDLLDLFECAVRKAREQNPEVCSGFSVGRSTDTANTFALLSFISG